MKIILLMINNDYKMYLQLKIKFIMFFLYIIHCVLQIPLVFGLILQFKLYFNKQKLMLVQ